MNGHELVWMMPSATEGHNLKGWFRCFAGRILLNWLTEQMVLCLAGSPGFLSGFNISKYERTSEQALSECHSWWFGIKCQRHERLVNTGSCSCRALMDKWSTCSPLPPPSSFKVLSRNEQLTVIGGNLTREAHLQPPWLLTCCVYSALSSPDMKFYTEAKNQPCTLTALLLWRMRDAIIDN